MANTSANTFAGSLNANFKVVYADKIKNLIPDGTKLLNKIDFSGREAQLGLLYSQPLILGLEQGITFADSTDDAFNLNAPIAGSLKEAQVRGSQMVLRSALGYAAASRAANGSQSAFEDATKFLVQNMMRSMAKKLEIEMLYGQVGYGTVSATSVPNNTFTVTTKEWAPGIWAGANSMPLEIRSPAGVLRGSCSVASVNMDTRVISVDLLPAGVIADDIIWCKGAYEKEFAGIHKILTNNGVLFGINAATYDLFRGNQETAGDDVLSFAVIQTAIARAVEKGLDSDVSIFVNPRAWADLLTEQAALRQYDSSYRTSNSENGSQEITFYAQNGKVEIVPSIYVKEGYAYVLAMDDYMRVGSTDITFRRPGLGDEFFRELENSAGWELRAYTDQACFCVAPGRSTLITNIVNNVP